MNYSRINIPYIENRGIELKAKEFLAKYWDKALPVDIEKIIDVSLGIDLIPVPELEKLCNIDALITSNWESIYIDKNLFEDERRQNRLRFSLAHEIGHFVLHKNIYDGFKINSFEDFYNFFENMPPEQYGYLETQAHKFAGYLLAPRDVVAIKLDKEYKKAQKDIDLKRLDQDLLRSYLAIPLAKIFGISQEAMDIVLSEFDLFEETGD